MVWAGAWAWEWSTGIRADELVRCRWCEMFSWRQIAISAQALYWVWNRGSLSRISVKRQEILGTCGREVLTGTYNMAGDASQVRPRYAIAMSQKSKNKALTQGLGCPWLYLARLTWELGWFEVMVECKVSLWLWLWLWLCLSWRSRLLVDLASVES